MKFTAALSAALASLVVSSASPVVERQTCPEAARFGNVQIVPSDLKPGDSYTVHGDFSCSYEKGYIPKYVNYYIEVPPAANNGHQAPMLIAMREMQYTPDTPSDTFTAQIPNWDGLVPGSNTYNVAWYVHYGRNTSDPQTPVYLVGSTQTALNLTVPSQ